MTVNRTRQHSPLQRAQGVVGFADVTPPPYQTAARNFLTFRARLDPSAVRAATPDQLDPAEDSAGYFVMATTDGGWALEPSSFFCLGLEVRDAPSQDGTRGMFSAVNYYAGQQRELFARHLIAGVDEGYSRQWNEGELWFGEAGRQTPEIRYSLRVTPDSGLPAESGCHHYLVNAPQGGINSLFIAYAGQFFDAEVVDWEILPDASDLLKSLAPIGIDYAFYGPGNPLFYAEPSLLGSSQARNGPGGLRVSLMELLSRIGHAAALVDRNNRLLFANDLAKAILSSSHIGDRLLAWRRQDQRDLDGALRKAYQSPLAPTAIPLLRPESLLPIFVQILPVSAALAEEPALLVLFRDPTTKGTHATPEILEALGLTPAEARLAAQVGAGQSVKESAEYVGITESTARSSLKIVYDKLGIGRQSELAGIVARLG